MSNSVLLVFHEKKDRIKAHIELCNKALMVLQCINAHIHRIADAHNYRLRTEKEEYISFYEHSIEIYVRCPKTGFAPYDIEVCLRTKYEETFEVKAHHIEKDRLYKIVKDLPSCIKLIDNIYDEVQRNNGSPD